MAKPVLASVMRRPRPSETRTKSAVEVPLTPEANDTHVGERLAERQALLDATPRRSGVGGDATLDSARGVLEATPEAFDAHLGERLAAGETTTPCEELQALLDATPRRGGVGSDAALDGARSVLEAAASAEHSTVSRKPRGVEHGVLDTRFTAVSRKFPSPWQQWFTYVKACSSQALREPAVVNAREWLTSTQAEFDLFRQSLMIGLIGSDAPCVRPLLRTRGLGFGVVR